MVNFFRERSPLVAIQERLAALTLLNLVRRYGGRIDGELSELESAMENMKVEMLRALERVDKLRRSTVKKLIQTLSPVQTVKQRKIYLYNYLV
ncbi:hypothetical protein V6N12_037960 [Hibiscus sabdariffa]|uniref:Uncharacterized protein n=1 Tax=Hibiscus sabdariffa TaxID=183260 RepID=A0ABR2BD92_9ROSI